MKVKNLMNIVTSVQECDATKLNSNNEVGQKLIQADQKPERL